MGKVGLDPLILAGPLSLPLAVSQRNYLVGDDPHLPMLSQSLLRTDLIVLVL